MTRPNLVSACDLAEQILATTRAELETELRWWHDHRDWLTAAARSVER